MTELAGGLREHLASGVTTVCRAWAVERRDGVVFGFTDHDQDLAFDAIAFKAESGMTARALQQTSGLSVDNSEAVGALSSAAISEADLLAGRFDGAGVRAWIVNWADASQRTLIFRGSLGEIVRSGGAFSAELRGLSDALNQQQGRAFQQGCSAVLGDASCAFDLRQPGFFVEAPVKEVFGRGAFGFGDVGAFPDQWFERGRLTLLDGEARGLVAVVKSDRTGGLGRRVELWEQIGPRVHVGDIVRLETGCDKMPKTCRDKFDNFLNFRGFPHIPGEDWLLSYPVSSGNNDGGSRG